jgi:hypothetical protein
VTDTNNPGSGSPQQVSDGTATTDPFAAAISGLDADLKSHVEKRGYKDLAGLIRSDMHGQQLLGADKASVLKIPATSRADNPSLWADVDKALGVPQDGKYPEWKPASGELAASPEQLSYFDAKMVAAGVPGYARNAALEAFQELNQQASADNAGAVQSEKAEGAQALQREWGVAYPFKLTAAGNALTGIEGRDQFDALMTRYGLQDHPTVMKVLAGVAEKLGESGVPTGGEAKHDQGALTPAEAEAKRAQLLADKAFMERYNGGDKAAIQQMLAVNNAIAAGASS